MQDNVHNCNVRDKTFNGSIIELLHSIIKKMKIANSLADFSKHPVTEHKFIHGQTSWNPCCLSAYETHLHLPQILFSFHLDVHKEQQ